MRKNRLQLGARLSLFIVSYLPLFFIMCIVQVFNYSNYLNWGGFSLESLAIFCKYFGAVSVLFCLSVMGVIGFFIFLSNVKRRCSTSGRTVKVIDIENKNSESISYLFTYIIPFVFQDLSVITNVISITTLLIVTCLIYINSSMILINPTISIKYTLYQVTYLDIESSKKRSGMFLTSSRYLDEDDILDIEDVGPKLFYAQTIKES
ncbi:MULTISPECIES: hypothetical protein [Shewanella]|uniref:hypothetical protein n=1 Tax=Shewanella TaxID=22 RepID=UPI0000DDD467|nr:MULTISPECIES: hypothetical protein [Shewanella]MCU8004203.1 hypothetical protein [Shewanella sp. SM96]